MNDIITISKFTAKDMLHRKSFVISTIIILLMIVIGCNIPKVIKSFDTEKIKEKILIVDKDNIFENKLNLLSNEETEIIVGSEGVDSIKEKILNDEIDLGLIIEKDNNSIKLTRVLENSFFEQDYISDLLTELYKNIQLSKLNLTEEEIMSLNPTFTYDVIQADTDSEVNIFSMMMISIVLFYAVYFCAYQVSSSITTEKTSKIIETLVTSTSPRNIVLGKTIGIGVVGLLQLILIITTAIISGKLFLDNEMINQLLDISSLTPFLGFITIVYFILGYSVYALLYALTGSTISKPEDIQSANSPVAIISLMGFYLSYFTLMNPNSNLNLIAGMLPISSAFTMPLRIMMGYSNAKEIILSISILLLTIFVIAKIAIKIYSNAILNYGTKMNLKDIINLYKVK